MRVKIVNCSENPCPSYATVGSAGMDIYSNNSVPIELKPMDRALISTGLFIELPVGYEAQLRPRSGLALKNGITLLNSPATIDSDYRGEINVLIINLGKENFIIEKGIRIAQMVIARYEKIDWEVGEKLGESERGIGGFGHTGI